MMSLKARAARVGRVPAHRYRKEWRRPPRATPPGRSSAVRAGQTGARVENSRLHVWLDLERQVDNTVDRQGQRNFDDQAMLALERGVAPGARDRSADSAAPRALRTSATLRWPSPTLGAALQNMETYFSRQDAELSLGMFCNIFHAAIGPDWSPLEVCFEHPQQGSPADHERYFTAPVLFFTAPVLFGQRTNAFAFGRSDLEVRMPGAAPYLLAVIRPLLESRCGVVHAHEDVSRTIPKPDQAQPREQ